MATTQGGLQQVGVQAVVLDAAQFAQLSKQVEQHIEGMNKASHKLAQEGSSSFQKFSDTGTKALVALTSALTAAFLAAQLLGGVNFLGAAASIEQGLAVVQSVSQGTQAQLSSLKDLTRELATTTVASFGDILTASAELARGGLEIEHQLGGALKSVINLTTAAAGELPFDKAARAIASAIPIFKLGAEETDRVANALVVAAQKSSASFNDIIRSFQQVAPLAPLLRIPIEDIAAAVGILGQAGLRGSDAGTSLKQAFIQLFAPTKKAAEMMNEYKINLFDANGAARPLGDTLLDLQDKFGDTAVAQGKITEAARANALAVIFGSDAIRAAALSAINGADAFFEMTDAMKNGTFTAEGLAKVISAPLQSQLKILQNNVVALSTDIGNGLVPVIRSLVVELIKAAQAAAPFAKAIGDALNFALTGTGFDELKDKLSGLFGSEIAASILALVSTIQASIGAASESIVGFITKVQEISGTEQVIYTIANAFYSMSNAIATVAAVTISIVDGLTNLAVLISTNEEAFNRFRTVLLSIVAGTTIAAFAGLIAIIATLAATFSSILIPMLAAGLAGAALVAILSNLGSSGVAAAQEIEEAFEEIDIVTPFTDAALEIPGVLEAIDLSIIQRNIAAQAPAIEEEIVSPFAQAGERIADILDEINISFGGFADVAIIGDAITEDVDEAVDALETLDVKTEETGKILDTIFANIKDTVGVFVEEIVAENQEIGQSFSDMGTVVSRVIGGFGLFFSDMGTFLQNMGTGIAETTKFILQFQLDSLESLKGVSSGFDALIDGLQTLLRAWATGWDAIVTIIGNAVNTGISLINRLGEAAANLANALPGSAGDAMFNSIPQIGIPRALSQIPTLAKSVGTAFDALGTTLRSNIDKINVKADEFRIKIEGLSTNSDALRDRLNRLGEAGERTGAGLADTGDGAKKAGKEAKEAGPAIDGFIDALEKAIRLQSFIDAFGDVGAKAVDSLVDALVSNIDKDGAKAAEALHKFKQLLRTELLPDWRELGHELDEVFALALIERTPEVLAAAISVVAKAADAVKAQGALTLETFKAAFDLGAINIQLGSQGSKLMTDLKKAIVEGGTDVVRAVGATAADIVSSFSKDLSPDQARNFTQQFMKAISEAIRLGTPEALAEFQNFSKQLNFDREILKAQNTLSKAIAAATKTYGEALNEINNKQAQSLHELDLTKFFKDQAEAEKEMLREIVDGHIEGLKRQQDNERRVRKERQEDLRQQLEDERSADDLRLRRADEMADALKAKRKRLAENLKGEAPSKDMQAQGRAIQGNSSTAAEDEVKALEERWRKEDERAAIVLERRNVDRAAQRQQQTDDQLFELQMVAEFERQKSVIEAPIRAAEKLAKITAHNTAVNNIVIQGNEQIAQLNRTLAQQIINAQLAFDEAKTKLDLEKEIADTVFDLMLIDAEAITAELEKQKALLMEMNALGKSGGVPGDDAQPALNTLAWAGHPGQNADGSWGVQVSIGGGGSADSSAMAGGVPLPARTGTTLIDTLNRTQQRLSAVEGIERGTPSQNSGSTITNNMSYNVNANYSNQQSEADVRLDMQALVALTS